jgi:CheY-like chemotaxis protein/anti-sigma regulatory factor (Ser/Thr protein kinase)
MTAQLHQDHDSLQKRVEEATLAIRKSKEKAELANNAKTKFLAAASHDLRQPIHALNLFLEVLSLTELNDRQRELLDKACAASNASSELLTTLLDFSRIEAGVVQPRTQTFFLQPLFNNIENELAPQADMKNITYRTRETLVAVQSDPKLVELILRNLVTNAIRYTEHGGLLVACRRHGGQAIVEVWDTGIGIAREQQEEVFLEFRQLGNPERDRQKGLGLGLAIALRLANTMGQRLSLSSIPNRGSVFRFTLPIAEIAAQRPLTEISQSLLMPLKVRILLIDDDKSVLEGMCHLLLEWGCECDATETIEAALAKANAHTPDIIISDYRLREQRNGVDAIVAIRALIGKTVPALLITGDTAPDRLREAKSSGIPLLHKPLSPNQLYRELVEVRQEVSRFTDL